MPENKNTSLFEALLPILFLIGLLTANVFLFDDTLGGANQIALLLAASLGGIIVSRNGQSWANTKDHIVKTIGSAMPSMLILLLIGSLAGTWMISGVVPAMIYYGMDIINPHVFLITAVIVCAIVSVATGSSWSTIATIGIALLGIGKAIGVNDAITAGAIISGAYFGDKISPLSDTTNLAPAMAGTDIFTHIRYMFYTTVPSMTITLIIFAIIGINYDFGTSITSTETVKAAIEESFNISPWLFLVPAILLTIIILKMPPLPALMIGSLLGGLFAIIFQPETIQEVAGQGISLVKASYIAVMQAMFGDVQLTTTNSTVNALLSTSGMRGMLNTIWLILSAMVFGGVPGRMFKKAYEEKGLKPEVLSRTLEDSGTMTSVLIPWNTCGATQSRILGVATFDYLPYAFFNIISPLMTILFAVLKIKIRRFKDRNNT
jgi:NhaC family Na+:H+ antiporter